VKIFIKTGLKQYVCGLFLIFAHITRAGDYIEKTDNYTYFRNFTEEDGLSSNMVLDIIQDKYNIMWFATINGLTRFDGSKFVTYRTDSKSTNSLSCNKITALAEDSFGNIWVGTAEGLNRYNRKTNDFTRFSKENGSTQCLKNNYIKALYIDKSDGLWIETKDGFLSKFDIKKNTWNHAWHPANNVEGDYYYHHIFEDSFGNLWIGGRNTDAIKVNSKDINTIETYDRNIGEKQYEASCFVETPNSELLCFNNSGHLLQYNREKNRFEDIDIPIDVSLTSAISDNKGIIWIGVVMGGIKRLDLLNKTITGIKNIPNNNNSLISNHIQCLYKDKNQRIWIGTEKGVSMYSEQLNFFRHYRQITNDRNSLSSNHITAMMQDKDGLLWIGTEENGVDTFSIDRETFGNISYNLLNQNLDKETFEKERYTLEQYHKHGIIKFKKTGNINVFRNYPLFRNTPLIFESLNENKIKSLYQDKKDNIYIGLWSHVGFNVYNKKTKSMKRYALWSGPANNKYPILFEGNPWGANWFTGFLEDNQSRLWCATWEAFGLNLFDREKGQFTGKHYIPGNLPRLQPKVCFAFDSVENRMYMGGSKYLGYFDFEHNEFCRFGEIFPKNYLNRDIIMNYYNYCKAKLVDLPLYFYCDDILYNDGAVWINEGNSIMKHTIHTEKFETIISSKENSHKTFSKSFNNQFLWVSIDNKIYRIHLKNNKVDSVKQDFPGVINLLYEDSNGILWIVDADGVYILDYSGFEKGKKIPAVKPKNSSELKNITTITGYKNHILIACSKGLAVIKGEEIVKIYPHNYPDPGGLPGTTINQIYTDKYEKLWICTNEGLAHLDLDSDKIEVFRYNPNDSSSIIGDIVNSVSEDNKDDMWISTTNGLCKLNPETKKFTDMSTPGDDCLSSRLAKCIIQDKEGNIWLGTTVQGVNVLNTTTDKIRHYLYHAWDKKGISDNYISCLFEDSQGYVWVGTKKGLNKYIAREDSFVRLPGMTDLWIMNIREDSNNNLWVSTDNGLYCMNLSGKIRKIFYDYHGLQDNTFNNAGCMLQDGRIGFGGNTGFTIFNPSDVLKETNPPNIVFSNFKVKDSLRFFDLNGIESIALNYDENSFFLDFGVTDYEYAPHLNFRYKLENFDNDWIYTDSKTLTAKYTNLSFGNYTFVAEVTDSHNEWKNTTKKITIHIATPWYYQGWFILSIILALLSSIILIIRWRERKLKKRNIELEEKIRKKTSELRIANEELKKINNSKNKFFGIISHDLKNPLKSLNTLFNQLNFIEKENRDDIIKIIQKETEKTGVLLENLLQWSLSQMDALEPDMQKIELNAEVNTIFDIFQLSADEKHVRLVNLVPQNRLVLADVNILSVIIRNLISNAIKYSYPNTDITISAVPNGDFVEISVEDKGIGISEKNAKKIFRLDSKLQTRGSSGESGTGLGLILVYEFVKLLGGKIGFQSEIEKGSKFTFSLKKYQDETAD